MAQKVKKINLHLKNLFISHEGNNYHPHILKSKRLLFHSLSAVVIKALVLIGIFFIPASAWLTPDILNEQSKKIIELTNEIRKNVGVNVLKENELLDHAALNKAQDMLIGQYFAHISPDQKDLNYFLKQIGYNYATAGENLAVGFSGADEVVKAWTKSKTHYANIIDPDFSEIGVGMVSGKYRDFDTTFVSEFFGAGSSPVIVQTAANKTVKNLAIKVASNINASDKVLGEKVIAAKPLKVDLAKTQIWVDEPQGKDEKIVRVIAYTSNNAISAEVNFGNYAINLLQDQTEHDKWSGSLIILKQAGEQIFNPVVLPTITISDELGNSETFDINWQNIKPVKSSLLNQYFFAKQSRSDSVKWLFDISSAYYKILLVLVIFSLLLNIIIQFNKQHYKIIIPSLGFIGLLAILILF